VLDASQRFARGVTAVARTLHLLLITGALALLSPSLALAQPAPHHAVGQVIHVTGDVLVPTGGAPMIEANKSNLFQVQNEPFRSILAGCRGRRVEAELRVRQPGPFGASVDAVWLLAKASSSVTVRSGASVLAPKVASLAAGRAFRIIGATLSHYRVQLHDGRRGYVSRHAAVAIGERPAPAPGPGIVGGLAGPALEKLETDWESALIDGTAAPAGAGVPQAARTREALWRGEHRDTKVQQLTAADGTITYAVTAEAPAGAVDFELLVRVYDAQGALLAHGHAGDSPQVYWD
jgi:hypothetical protein